MPDPDELDPDMPNEYDDKHSAMPTADDPEIGETDRIAEEKDIYKGASSDGHSDHGHAVGGSEGTADGQ
ncbi:hypothetical protein V1Y59_11615 [Gordonia sp. PKS22-38]|uniref:Uncharacterized protein n=1 Tax=Gordonia prachuapensis TaxID=3115651 RepID=A0ABU7MTT2_9ACTN|nr:hypothetical protein [Gordonia sp. PKS22-38]